MPVTPKVAPTCATNPPGNVKLNQLLSRLDKLLYSGPNVGMLSKAAGVKARRDFEKRVVSWMDDSLVPQCPHCGNNFGMFRRRHHCRLCGGVLCGSCSLGLTTADAVKLLKTHLGKPQGQQSGKKAGLGDGQCRMCQQCHECFATATTKTPVEKSKGVTAHPVVTLHTQLLDIVKQLNLLLPGYIDLAAVLGAQQHLTRYEEALTMKAKIDKLFEFLNHKSKQVLAMVKDKEPSTSTFKVHAKIRARFVEYLQNNMIPLPTLPPEKDVAAWRQRSAKAEQKALAIHRCCPDRPYRPCLPPDSRT